MTLTIIRLKRQHWSADVNFGFLVLCGWLNIYYTYLVYHVNSLCAYTAIYTFSKQSAMANGRPPTTVVGCVISALLYVFESVIQKLVFNIILGSVIVFSKQSTIFLGYLDTQFSMLKDKTAIINDFPGDRTRTSPEIRSLIGICKAYSQGA